MLGASPKPRTESAVLPVREPLVASFHTNRYVLDLARQKTEVIIANPAVLKARVLEFQQGAYEFQGSFPFKLREADETFKDDGHKALVFCEPRTGAYKLVIVTRNVKFIEPLLRGQELKFEVSATINDEDISIQVYHPTTGKLCTEISATEILMAELASLYKPACQTIVDVSVKQLKAKNDRVEMLMAAQVYNLTTEGDIKYLGLDLSQQAEGYQVFLFGDKTGDLYAVCAGPATDILINAKAPPATEISIKDSKKGSSPVITTKDGKTYRFKTLPKKPLLKTK